MATTKFDLTNEAWVNIGAMPCLIQVTTGHVKYALGAAPGSIDADALTQFPGAGKVIDLSNFSTGNVFARSGGLTATAIVTRP
jgi:hypothetical protein